MESPKSTQNALALHQALVEQLKRAGQFPSPRVEAAFRAVPRHLFLPDVELEKVYQDEAIPTKFQDELPISSSSQPTMMAIMLQQLDLKPGQRVLEIGAGTGYNAALIAHIVGEQGHVVTLDIDEDIVAQARAHLKAAGFDRVLVIRGDGGEGYPEAAPYDRILLTVGAADIAPAWREQLKPGGRLVLPLSLRGPQISVAFEPSDGGLTSFSTVACGFMRLRGSFGETETKLSLGPEPGLSIQFDSPASLEAETIYKLLTGPSRDWNTQVRVKLDEIIWGGLGLWLASRTANTFGLKAEGEMIDRGLVPDLFGKPNTASTLGVLLDEGGFCLLMRPPGQAPLPEQPESPPPFELFVRSFGADEIFARRLVDHIRAWDRAGRPRAEQLQITARPVQAESRPATGLVIRKRWTQFGVAWKGVA